MLTIPAMLMDKIKKHGVINDYLISELSGSYFCCYEGVFDSKDCFFWHLSYPSEQRVEDLKAEYIDSRAVKKHLKNDMKVIIESVNKYKKIADNNSQFFNSVLHISIAKLSDSYDKLDCLLVIERLQSIREFLNKNRNNFTLSDFMDLSIGIFNTLNVCHKDNFMCTNLTENSAFIRMAPTGKIEDYTIGLAKSIKTRTLFNDKSNSDYLPPEILNGERKLLELDDDIYAAGIVLFKVLNNMRPPFINGVRKKEEAIPNFSVSFDEIKPVLEKILSFDKNERYEDCNSVIKVLEKIKSELGSSKLNRAIDDNTDSKIPTFREEEYDDLDAFEGYGTYKSVDLPEVPVDVIEHTESINIDSDKITHTSKEVSKYKVSKKLISGNLRDGVKYVFVPMTESLIISLYFLLSSIGNIFRYFTEFLYYFSKHISNILYIFKDFSAHSIQKNLFLFAATTASVTSAITTALALMHFMLGDNSNFAAKIGCGLLAFAVSIFIQLTMLVNGLKLGQSMRDTIQVYLNKNRQYALGIADRPSLLNRLRTFIDNSRISIKSFDKFGSLVKGKNWLDKIIDFIKSFLSFIFPVLLIVFIFIVVFWFSSIPFIISVKDYLVTNIGNSIEGIIGLPLFKLLVAVTIIAIFSYMLLAKKYHSADLPIRYRIVFFLLFTLFSSSFAYTTMFTAYSSVSGIKTMLDNNVARIEEKAVNERITMFINSYNEIDDEFDQAIAKLYAESDLKMERLSKALTDTSNWTYGTSTTDYYKNMRSVIEQLQKYIAINLNEYRNAISYLSSFSDSTLVSVYTRKINFVWVGLPSIVNENGNITTDVTNMNTYWYDNKNNNVKFPTSIRELTTTEIYIVSDNKVSSAIDGNDKTNKSVAIKVVNAFADPLQVDGVKDNFKDNNGNIEYTIDNIFTKKFKTSKDNDPGVTLGMIRSGQRNMAYIEHEVSSAAEGINTNINKYKAIAMIAELYASEVRLAQDKAIQLENLSNAKTDVVEESLVEVSRVTGNENDEILNDIKIVKLASKLSTLISANDKALKLVGILNLQPVNELLQNISIRDSILITESDTEDTKSAIKQNTVNRSETVLNIYKLFNDSLLKSMNNTDDSEIKEGTQASDNEDEYYDNIAEFEGYNNYVNSFNSDFVLSMDVLLHGELGFNKYIIQKDTEKQINDVYQNTPIARGVFIISLLIDLSSVFIGLCLGKRIYAIGFNSVIENIGYANFEQRLFEIANNHFGEGFNFTPDEILEECRDSEELKEALSELKIVDDITVKDAIFELNDSEAETVKNGIVTLKLIRYTKLKDVMIELRKIKEREADEVLNILQTVNNGQLIDSITVVSFSDWLASEKGDEEKTDTEFKIFRS